ncbi:MAG: hypothetical protein KDD48_03560, partial [Bdellovibrionales bacterium]|nr:hypothetical protein [Bdellovibrionales bacterium]
LLIELLSERASAEKESRKIKLIENAVTTLRNMFLLFAIVIKYVANTMPTLRQSQPLVIVIYYQYA